MEKLLVSSSPHLRSGASTQRIMLDVIIALCPALIASFVFFGPRALLLVAVYGGYFLATCWGSRRLLRSQI